MNDIHPRMTGFPAWLATIDASLPVTAQYVLHGNLRDLHLLKAQPIPLEEALWRCLQANGYSFLLWYSPAGLRILPDNPQQGAAARSAAARVLGVQTSQLPARMTVADLPAVLQRLGAPVQAGQPALPHGAIALDYVSQWRPAGEPPSPEEHALMLAALARAHAVQAYPVADGPRPSALFQPVFWLVDRPGDLPTWLTGGSDGIRQVPVPMPDLQARTDAAQALTRGITQGDQETLAQAQTKAVKPFADATEGMTLKAMVQVVQLCNDRGLGPDGVTDAVRAHRIGVLENPWAKSEVRGRIRSAAATLRQQVFGQDRAIDHAVDILSRSSMGLTQAYRQEAGGGPRGILFFAGPTGVGKTELAKAITRMVFGDERAYIRLDMSEFSSEHTEARLIGSPPGYVGHGAGGELTNAVRQRPFSLVLFDEIEKAHPRIMDKFLQILSDGRLTDGSGSTVHFSECLIVFTSNLGIRPLADGETPPTGTAHETEVVDAISDAFVHEYQRPELLGRIGKNNIVVFDYITPEIGRQLAAKFIDAVSARVQHDLGITVFFTDALRTQLIELAIADLSKGGRGIALGVENVLVNPLARELIRVPEGTRQLTVTGITQEGGWQRLTVA